MTRRMMVGALILIAPFLASAHQSIDSEVADSLQELLPNTKTDALNCIIGYGYDKNRAPQKGQTQHQTTLRYIRLGVEQERILVQKSHPSAQTKGHEVGYRAHVQRVLKANEERMCAKQDTIGGEGDKPGKEAPKQNGRS